MTSYHVLVWEDKNHKVRHKLYILRYIFQIHVIVIHLAHTAQPAILAPSSVPVSQELEGNYVTDVTLATGAYPAMYPDAFVSLCYHRKARFTKIQNVITFLVFFKQFSSWRLLFVLMMFLLSTNLYSNTSLLTFSLQL